MNTRDASIFVSIANYRDGETPYTVLDLFTQAAYPERVTVGVLSQIMPGMDEDCLAPKRPGVRQTIALASESLGACWARSRILTELREDEDYVLQIDSHSRFVPRWDERFLQMLAACPSERALLSAYPSSYIPPDRLGEPLISVHIPKDFDQYGVLTFKSRTYSYEQRPAAPIPSAFVGAGCLFAPAEAFEDVPYDPHLYFIGEEATLSARLWTHGWDSFAPNDVLMYHDYSQDRGRPKHWEDHRDWNTINRRSVARIRHLLAGEAAEDPAALERLECYGLGTVRSLADYERRAGVDFARRQIHMPAG